MVCVRKSAKCNFLYNMLGSYIFYYSYRTKYQVDTYMFSIYVKSTEDYNKI